MSLMNTSVDTPIWLEVSTHVPCYFSIITIEHNLILKPLARR
jgi:hypothetical protein